MKKIAAIFLCIFMAAGFTACSGDAAVDTQPAASVTDTEITEAQITAETQSEMTTSGRSEKSEAPASEETLSSETTDDEDTSNETTADTSAAETTRETTETAAEAVTTAATSAALTTTVTTEAAAIAATTTAVTTAAATPANATAEAAVTEPSSAGGKTLVAYFSWSGNTIDMANIIADKTGGELFEIVPVTPYPEEYTPCTEVALEERDSNARPEIKDLPASIDEYDTIFIGYPIWWHTAPMIIGTFLESYDLTDAEIYPFTQSASMDEGQFEQSMEFVRSCAGNGNVHEGLFVRPRDEAAIEEYLKNNGLAD